jgi:hypothetical protein
MSFLSPKNRVFKDAIFIVTEERVCPAYSVGDELKVEGMKLSVPEAKPICLKLVENIIKTVSRQSSFEKYTPQGIQKTKFDCGGCDGLIRFEFKKEKGFATIQMKLFAVAEQRERMKHMDRFFDVLHQLEFFEPLDDDGLRDLSAMLQLKEYADNKVVLKKGSPGTHLYIILEGVVGVISDDGQTLSRMGSGDIFGEMSLLSGEPVTTTIHTKTKTRLASLASKNFKHILNKFPVLQVFFYKKLVERTQVNSLCAGDISSEMSGELSEINMVDLFQLINSSQKTGRVEFDLDDGKAFVLFHDGELVQASYNTFVGKEAFFIMLAKQAGRFTYTSGISKKDKQLNVIGGFMGLIMEGLRRIDDKNDC